MESSVYFNSLFRMTQQTFSLNSLNEKEYINLFEIDIQLVSLPRSYQYVAQIKHTWLNELKIIKSSDENILNNKIQTQITLLEYKWSKKMEQDRKKNSQEEADRITSEAIKKLYETENILKHTLSINNTVDWETIKSHISFNEKKPGKPNTQKIPSEPQITDSKFVVPTNLITLIFWKEKKEVQMKQEFERLHEDWAQEKSRIEAKNKQIENDHNIIVRKWEDEKQKYEKNQQEGNDKVEVLKKKYSDKDWEAIIEYCDMVLNNSQYPDFVKKDFEIDYNPDTHILILEYILPPIGTLPNLNEVKYIASKDEMKEYYISESKLKELFDITMYNIALRTLHELFEADVANAIDVIVFNGWVTDINKTTGREQSVCILSVQAKKEEFMDINLELVDPKACFKWLKGVASTKLSGITPVQPLITISHSDKRFTNHYDVADGLNKGVNLAEMDWEDFEHLIREVFSFEFSSNGWEVRVTQASRDGGVDAIAFDPDPIRGGKIVIQAKRYTNTVWVSAVRDLYGTVMNEGATKGILVTTADFWPDAYEFVKWKPLTLMSGANLLYLLEKHGHSARIDIKEARANLK